jgi:ABC-type multidrug transport system ATPase subunit
MNTELKPAIIIQDLYKSYGKKEVLKGLDLEVYNGELFGFLGRNVLVNQQLLTV